jgi:hypothetical protein
MSWRKGQPSGRGKKAAWSGGSAAQAAPRRRWQEPADTRETKTARRRRSRNRWAITALMALALLSFLVWLLLQWNPKTPFVFVTVTKYDTPVPVNAWAVEDRAALELLNGSNISVPKLPEWKADGNHFELLPESFHVNDYRQTAPVVIYVSAHGVVRDDGAPCILPPGASIHESKNWITVKQLLDEIHEKIPSSRNTLLVLDCNRIRVGWNLGIVYNSFAEQVEALVNGKDWPGIAVLLSAGPGQVNWASDDFRGTIFGRFLQLGLAGAADTKAVDGDVSLDELADYLKHEVSAWALANRGEPQEPVLLPRDAKSFHVCYPIRGSSLPIKSTSLKDLTRAFEDAKSADNAELASAELEMWKQLDKLRDLNLVRSDPAAWSNFEHQLLRLDELSHGGEAYADEAKKLQADLHEKLDKAVEAGKNTSAGSRKAEDYFGITRQATWMHKTDVGYSLPACEYFGVCTAEQAEQVRTAWKRLMDSRVNGTADEIIDASKAAQVARDLTETQFLAAIRQQQIASLWPNTIKLEDVQARRTAAEEASVPREPSGKPGDERAHYFGRSAADKADPQRRLAEDLMFVGQRNAAKQYPKLARATDDLNAWTSQVMQDASGAFRTRDEVYAVTPYLADWLCSPLSGAIQDRQQLIVGRLVPLLQETGALNDALNDIDKLKDAEYLKPGTPLPLRLQAERVRSEFDAIRARFEEKCKELAKKGKDDSAEWRQLEAALQTPIIPATARDKLRTKQAELATELHHAFFEHESEPKHNDKEGEAESAHQKHKESSYLETVHQWKVHPLFEILRTAAPGIESPLKWSTKANADARSALKEHRTEKEKETGKVAAARHRLSDAETDLRSKAALICNPLNEKSDGKDAVSELRQFDIQQLLIWNGQRAAAELWQNTVRTDSPTPFFARAAHAYLHAADGLIEPRLAAVTDQIDHIERSIPKPEGFSIKPTAQVASENEKAAIVSIAVGDDGDSSQFSSGVGALYLREGSQRLVDLPIQTDPPGRAGYVDMSAIGKKPQVFDMNIADASAYNSAMQAVVFFRGRDIPNGFDLPVLNGLRVDYKPYHYQDQSITLVGDRLQRSSIEFILDCSESMEEQTSIRGEVKGKNETAQRLSLAQKQLKTMLDELVARNQQNEDIHVGLRLFGHRVGWFNGIANGTMLVQENYKKQEAELKKLGPSRDIEVALTVGKFDDTANEDIKHRIDGLKPYGETPLYLALKEALQDFQAESTDSRKCIIAITDGKNNQTSPDTYAEGVLETWKKYRVPIYILGFDITKDEAEQARREYTELATATGGKFLPVNNGNELLNTLRQTLLIDLYSVLESGHPPTKLNESTPIDTAQLPKDYTVSYRGINKSVRLEGGEAIALYMSDNGQDIIAKPYKPEIEPIVLRAATSRKPLQLRIHRPMRDKAHDAVQFSISLQVDPRADHFTGRPLETWLEITPLGDNSSEYQSYVFYDVNFEPQEPVPVLNWKALNWPKDATRAQIRFWCKYVPTTPTQAIPLRDLVGKTQSVAGVGLTAKTSNEGADYLVRIEEQHGPQPSGIYGFRIGFENELHEKPIRVIHQFDAHRGVATHSYYFPGELRESLERPQIARVVITSGKDLKDGALQLPPNGVVLPISAAGELFSPNATINGR